MALALQGPPFLLSNWHSPCNSLCVCPTATALRLLTSGVPTGELGTTTRDAPRLLYAVTLRVSEALALLALQRTIWSDVRLHGHSQTAEFGIDTSGPRATDTMKWGRSRFLLGSWSRLPERSCITAWAWISRASSSYRTTLSGIPLPRFFTSCRTQRSSGSVVLNLTTSP